MQPTLHDVRLPVDGDRIVDVGADAGLPQFGQDCVPLPADIDGVLMKDVGPTVGHDRSRDWQVRQCRRVAGCNRLAPGRVAVELVQLDEPDGRGDVGHPEVEAQHLELIAAALALVAIDPQPVGQGRI